MKVTFRDICWFAVVALIVLFLSKCHRDQQDDLSNKLKEVGNKMINDSIAHITDIILLEQKLIDQQAKTNQAVQQAQLTDAKLEVSQSTITKLAKALQVAKQLPFDTSFVTVSPDFVTYCDSLAIEAENLNRDVNKYKDLNKVIMAGKSRELLIKDSILMRERMFASECRKQFADLQIIYGRQAKEAKAKNQIYVGAEILGTQTTFLQNVGGVISLKTKGNKLWQISSGLQSNGLVYGRINGNILLSFK